MTYRRGKLLKDAETDRLGLVVKDHGGKVTLRGVGEESGEEWTCPKYRLMEPSSTDRRGLGLPTGAAP
ncbi:hypothetical protein [Streptomyces luteireticuli]|uniref:hypothetical protein n=1 Tax=Streptomyces luteireticuli TaxID=173858 RepID=UPI00355930C4